MSQDTSLPSDEADNKNEENHAKSIYLVSYPKVVFMYPTMIAALVCGVYMQFFAGPLAEYIQDDGQTAATSVGAIFLIIFAINIIVISFDFPRTTSLTLFFVCFTILLIGYLVATNFPNFLPFLTGIATAIQPVADATFYYLIATIFFIIYIFVGLNSQFDYWEVRPNELLHHHGLLSDLERFSAPNLRIDKEINDLFEYMLLRSGRLILHPSQERKAVVLENVFFIGNKEREITRMLGAVQVQVRTDNNS